MSDAELWSAWRMWIVVATVVVLLAAGLLITILVTARRILRDAVRALNAVEIIRKNTQPIWELQTTNHVAEQILTDPSRRKVGHRHVRPSSGRR